MSPGFIERTATVIFALAVIHTFGSKFFNQLAVHHPKGSPKEAIYHFLGEIEVIFGIWAAVFVGVVFFVDGGAEALRFIDGVNYTEPLFVFVIMAMASTKPLITFLSLIHISEPTRPY